MWGKYTLMIKVNVNIIGGKTWFCDKNKFKGEETGWVTSVVLQVIGQVMEIRYGDKNVSFFEILHYYGHCQFPSVKKHSRQ